MDARDHLRTDAERDVYRLAFNSAVAAGESDQSAAGEAARAVGHMRVADAGGQAIVFKFDLSVVDKHGSHDQKTHGNRRGSLSSEARSIMEESVSGQADNSVIARFMEAEGLSVDDYQRVNDLYYKHNVQSSPATDEKILDVWHSDSPEGQAMRAFAQWNEWQVETEGRPPATFDVDSVKQSVSQMSWKRAQDFYQGAELFQNKEGYFEYLDAQKRGEPIFYRKGDVDRGVVSMTSNERGARSGGSWFKPTHAYTYDQMRGKGYRLAAGARGLIGVTSGQESEYIWIKPRDAEKRFDPNQPRDEKGQWTTSWGGAKSEFSQESGNLEILQQFVQEGLIEEGVRPRKQNVKIADLHATQSWLEPDKENRDSTPIFEDYADLPVVVRTDDGVSHLLDGHHRVASMVRDGGKSVRAYVFRAPDLSEFIEKRFNPNQPRDPEGTPTGGQFASTAGGRDTLVDAEEDRDEWPDHIKDLKIPPAWTDVKYNVDPSTDLLATGRDAKGRSQAVYSEAFSARQAAAKFARVQELDAKFAAVKREVDRDAQSEDEKVAEHAQATQLVMATGIRPGSDGDTGAEVKAYGATTLEGRHVKSSGGKVTLEFVGKKGVSLSIPVKDRSVAKMVQDRSKKAGKSGQLFPSISQSSLGKYVQKLDSGGFKTKDLRTALGTRTAREAVAKMDPPTSFAAYKRAVRAVAVQVSEKLGNTPTVALQSYVDPTVFTPWAGFSSSSGGGKKLKKASSDRGYDVHFGRVGAPLPIWRDADVRDSRDSDEELARTPRDVVGILGFDPLEFDDRVEKHTPGGHEHDQKTHAGDRGGDLEEFDDDLISEVGDDDPEGSAELTEAKILTGREQFAVDNYTTNGYKHINDSLRRGLNVSPSTKEQIALLDGLVESQEFVSDGVVFRGVPGKRFARSLKTGSLVRDSAFMSTSSEVSGVHRAMRDTGEGHRGYTILEIRVPRGTKAYAPENGRGESEVLLGRGTYLRVGASREVGGNTFVTVEVE